MTMTAPVSATASSVHKPMPSADEGGEGGEGGEQPAHRELVLVLAGPGHDPGSAGRAHSGERLFPLSPPVLLDLDLSDADAFSEIGPLVAPVVS